MARYENFIMSEDFLDKNKRAIFVFGDNTLRQGYGGAAALRDHPQTYGFITKKYPDNHDTSFYKPEDYNSIFFDELIKLRVLISDEPFKTFYISQLGAGLANKYNIWEKVIKEGLENNLQQYPNVVFLWEQ
jgi:hypothetical protein